MCASNGFVMYLGTALSDWVSYAGEWRFSMERHCQAGFHMLGNGGFQWNGIVRLGFICWGMEVFNGTGGTPK